MHENLTDRITRTPEEMRLFQQERAIMEVTELISGLMEEHGMTKADLARQLGTSKANITQMLDGRRNMTIRTISDVLFVLDSALEVRAASISEVMNAEFQKWQCTTYYPMPRSTGAKAWHMRPEIVTHTHANSQRMAG